MSNVEPTSAYVLQSIGVIEAERKWWPSDRLWGVGMPREWNMVRASFSGLTRTEAQTIADALNAHFLPAPPAQEPRND